MSPEKGTLIRLVSIEKTCYLLYSIRARSWKHSVSPRALEDLTTAAVGCPLGPGNASLIVASYKQGIRRTVTADRLATTLSLLRQPDTTDSHTKPCWCGRCLFAGVPRPPPSKPTPRTLDARRRSTSRPPCTQTSDSQSILVRAVSSAFGAASR